MKSVGGILSNEKDSKNLSQLLLLAAIFCAAMAVSQPSWSAPPVPTEEKTSVVKTPSGRKVSITKIATQLRPTGNPIAWIDDRRFFFAADPTATGVKRTSEIGVYIYTLGKGAEFYRSGRHYCYDRHAKITWIISSSGRTEWIKGEGPPGTPALLPTPKQGDGYQWNSWSCMYQPRPATLEDSAAYWIPLASEDGYLEVGWKKASTEVDMRGVPVRWQYPVPKDLIFFSQPLKKNIPTPMPDYLFSDFGISYLQQTRQYLIFDGRMSSSQVGAMTPDKTFERPSAMWVREKCRRAMIITIPDRIEELCLPPLEALQSFSLTRHGIVGFAWEKEKGKEHEPIPENQKKVFLIEGQSMTHLLDGVMVNREVPRTSPDGCRVAVAEQLPEKTGGGGKITVIDVCDGQ